MRPARAALCAVLLIAAGACARPKAGEHAEDKAFNDKVHAYLVSHPEVILEMQDAFMRKQASDQQKEMAVESGQVQARIPALRQQIFDDPRDPAVGPKNAKVTVVEFFDYRCPHCKDAAPDMVKLIKAHPDVRFVFKEMPIFGAQSQAAAAAALAASRQGKYLPVYQDLMADRVVDQDSVSQILARNGLNPVRTLEESSDPKIAIQIADVQRLGKALGVQGTPGFLINDRYVVGADMDAVTKAIDEQQKKAG